MENFIEAILLWNERGPNEQVNHWLEDHGLSVIPMSGGLLITGTYETFEAAFAVDLANADLPFQLPVPPSWPEHVATIGIPRLRIPHN